MISLVSKLFFLLSPCHREVGWEWCEIGLGGGGSPQVSKFLLEASPGATMTSGATMCIYVCTCMFICMHVYMCIVLYYLVFKNVILNMLCKIFSKIILLLI